MEYIRFITHVFGRPLGLPSPVSNPSPQPRRFSSFIRRLSVSDLVALQFNSSVLWVNGSTVNKTAFMELVANS